MEVATAPSARLTVTVDPKSAVTVRFSAGAADVAGAQVVRLPVSNGVTIREAFSEIVQMFPVLKKMEGRLLFAANSEFAGYDRVLHAGDQLCLISPVSGGAYL